jgi:hypothetical protein
MQPLYTHGVLLASFEIIREEPVKPPIKDIILHINQRELEMLIRDVKDSGYTDDYDLLCFLRQAQDGTL